MIRNRRLDKKGRGVVFVRILILERCPPDPGISLVGRDGIGIRKGDYHGLLWW